MVNQGYMVDLNKPLVFQVGRLGEAYNEWVHQPIVIKETPRIFANGVFEFMTRTPWWTIPTVWLPVVCWLISSSVKNGLPPYHLAMSLIAGVCFWTLLEYALHRFLFHIKTTGYWFGKHNSLPPPWMPSQAPNGWTPTCFPSSCYCNFLVPLWNKIKLLAPASCAPAFLAGALLGYVIYDCTHYYLHYGKPSKGVPHDLKRHHMNHHFKIQDKGFGITSAFWDRIFGTLPPKPAKKSN